MDIKSRLDGAKMLLFIPPHYIIPPPNLNDDDGPGVIGNTELRYAHTPPSPRIREQRRPARVPVVRTLKSVGRSHLWSVARLVQFRGDNSFYIPSPVLRNGRNIHISAVQESREIHDCVDICLLRCV